MNAYNRGEKRAIFRGIFLKHKLQLKFELFKA